MSRLDHRINGKAATTSDSDASPRPSPEESARVTRLSNFQVTCLTHALKFPSLRRFTYSTCSVYEDENEAVVSEILALCRQVQGVGEKSQFRLEKVLPSWKRRGYPGPLSGVQTVGVRGVAFPFVAFCNRRAQARMTDFDLWSCCSQKHPKNTLAAAEAECVCRVMPDKDKMNGFFLACFTRDPVQTQHSKSNEHAAKEQSAAAKNSSSVNASAASGGAASKTKRKRPSSKQRKAARKRAALAVESASK